MLYQDSFIDKPVGDHFSFGTQQSLLLGQSKYAPRDHKLFAHSPECKDVFCKSIFIEQKIEFAVLPNSLCKIHLPP